MSDTTLTATSPFEAPADAPAIWGLGIAWSLDEPERWGETLVLRGQEGELGRGPGEDGGHGERLAPFRIRPGATASRPPLATRRISRRQLKVRGGARLTLTRIGKTRLLVGGRAVDEVTLDEGDVVELENALVLVVVKRPLDPPALTDPFPDFPFGTPDAYGIVGESHAAWELRRSLAFVAGRPGHVLLQGPSGAGKELAARAIHGLAGRGPWVGRNAATIPESLAAAELFGNRRNYPNPGMADRVGLVGEADGGTLLLDEIGEIPVTVQAGLLRVLDAGEYQRLGESNTRVTSARILGATHRPVESLKHDLLARFRHRIHVPGLDARPDDVPLLARHLLRQAADDPVMRTFVPSDSSGAAGHPRVTPRFVQTLVARSWETHVRELDRILWEKARTTNADFLDASQPPPPPETLTSTDPASLSRSDIEAALEACDGVVSRAWKHLGLNSRDQLRRLIKKHGLR